MARKSGLVLRHGRMRRETRWLDLTQINSVLGAASTAILLQVLTTEEKALRPFTIIRTRLNWTIQSDQVIATEAYAAALGMAVVSDQAVAIGATAIPTPATDLASDLWFLHDIISSRFQFLDATGFQVGAPVMKDIDSKAMRKVEDGQDVVLVAETFATSFGVLVQTAGRMLIKLH